MIAAKTNSTRITYSNKPANHRPVGRRISTTASCLPRQGLAAGDELAVADGCGDGGFGVQEQFVGVPLPIRKRDTQLVDGFFSRFEGTQPTFAFVHVASSRVFPQTVTFSILSSALRKLSRNATEP
jgi:hypothetical protein